MVEFKPLEIDDYNIFNGYLKGYPFNTYEYSFLNLYLWRKYCNVEYAVVDDVLIIKKTVENVGSYFMQPIGYVGKNLKSIISMLMEIKQKDIKMKSLFRDIEEPFLNELKGIYGEKLLFDEDVKNFDYIYETQKLINLKGEKLRKRKLQYNQFNNNYDFTIRDIHDESVMKDCVAFAEIWFESQKNRDSQIVYELDGIKDVFLNLKRLNAIGMAVYVDGIIAGFTIGEKVNKRMAIIHIEKGDTNYKGIYAFINRTFAEEYLRDVAYINREEDVGIEGLRRAKLAYDPVKLEKKYIVDIQ